MALLSTRFDVLRCKKEHLIPILVGIYLRDGILRIELTSKEEEHISMMFEEARRSPLGFLNDAILYEATKATGVDQVPSHNSQLLLGDRILTIRDLDRVRPDRE